MDKHSCCLKFGLSSSTQKSDGLFPLDEAEENTLYHVEQIVAPIATKRRLLDLGFVDCGVKIAKKSLGGGVFLLVLRGYVLALKREEVHAIWVKR